MIFFLESVDDAMEVDVSASVTPSGISLIIPNIDDESTLSEVFQSASDVAKYGDLCISALKEFPRCKVGVNQQDFKTKLLSFCRHIEACERDICGI